MGALFSDLPRREVNTRSLLFPSRYLGERRDTAHAVVQRLHDVRWAVSASSAAAGGRVVHLTPNITTGITPGRDERPEEEDPALAGEGKGGLAGNSSMSHGALPSCEARYEGDRGRLDSITNRNDVRLFTRRHPHPVKINIHPRSTDIVSKGRPESAAHHEAHDVTDAGETAARYKRKGKMAPGIARRPASLLGAGRACFGRTVTRGEGLERRADGGECLARCLPDWEMPLVGAAGHVSRSTSGRDMHAQQTHRGFPIGSLAGPRLVSTSFARFQASPAR